MKGRWRAGSGGAAARQCGQLRSAGHALVEPQVRAHGRHGFAVVPDAFYGVQLPAEGQAPARGLGLGRGEVVQRACVAVGALAQGGGLRWQVGVVGFGVLVARQDGQGRGKQACQAVGIGQSTVLRKLLFISDSLTSATGGENRAANPACRRFAMHTYYLWIQPYFLWIT